MLRSFPRSTITRISIQGSRRAVLPSLLHVTKTVAPLAARTVVSSRNFSISATNFKSTELKETANDLFAALQAEKSLEDESASESTEENTKLEQWPSKNGFTVHFKLGKDRVQLEKKLENNEVLRVFFSPSDVSTSDPMMDEPETVDGEELEEDEGMLPISAEVIVERESGSLLFDVLFQGDMVHIESATPFASTAEALDESVEAESRRAKQYSGPPFETLDPSVQNSVQNFLEARGVDSDFALFLQEYAALIENKEYTNWLGEVSDILK